MVILNYIVHQGGTNVFDIYIDYLCINILVFKKEEKISDDDHFIHNFNLDEENYEKVLEENNQKNKHFEKISCVVFLVLFLVLMDSNKKKNEEKVLEHKIRNVCIEDVKAVNEIEVQIEVVQIGLIFDEDDFYNVLYIYNV